jgi:hypothetical protein
MVIQNWQQMYICEDMRRESQWAEYEEIIEEEQGISEEDAVELFMAKFGDIPADVNEAVIYIVDKAREGEMNDEEMTTGFFICGQIDKHDDLDAADKLFWEIEKLFK